MSFPWLREVRIGGVKGCRGLRRIVYPALACQTFSLEGALGMSEYSLASRHDMVAHPSPTVCEEMARQADGGRRIPLDTTAGIQGDPA
jgi:hypothetical protein